MNPTTCLMRTNKRFAAWLFFALASMLTASAGAQAIASKFADVNGVRLHYLVAGKGAPIMLVHGYAETSHMWIPLMKQLAKTNLVVAPDLRGAGSSDAPDGGYAKADLAKDVHALAVALKLGPVKIVGHDIGLMVAYAYAAQFPADVTKIVLMDAFLPGVGDWTHVWLLRDLWHFHFYGPTPLALVSGRERIYFEHFWNDFAADKTHSLSEADRRFYTREYAKPGHMKAGMAYFQNFEGDAKTFAELSKTKLTMPMLVIAGEKASGEFLVNQGKLVATNVQGVVVPGSGHWLMEEAPEVVIPQLVAFLAN